MKKTSRFGKAAAVTLLVVAVLGSGLVVAAMLGAPGLPARLAGVDTGVTVSDAGVQPLALEETQRAPMAESASTESAQTIDAAYVIRTATIAVRVDAVPAALDELRTLSSALGGRVESLDYTGDTEGVERAERGDARGATVVLRVPAPELEAAIGAARSLGDVVSESAGEQDVTQQVIDVEARLVNLESHEARLRSFFDDATEVSEMLAIEEELARVRGEIESLRAQQQFLEEQVAFATLTVRLAEPGAIVSPAGADWGLAAAVTRGVRAAASLTGIVITLAIALAPALVIAASAALIVRLMRRRRAVAHGETA